jgi:phage FluMu protein Com
MTHRMSNGKARSFVLRVFKCPGCGRLQTAPKGWESEPGHIKDMYCPFCKEVQKFIQYDTDRIFTR